MSRDAKLEHRLAAIMATDVVGYSQSMQSDEAATLAALTAIREATENQISQYRGRIANTAGDSVLAEFGSAVEAVSCAMALQQELSGRAQRDGLQVRIGIHLGDVVDKGGDLFGTAVNIAARLEGIAQPGSIVVSAAVRDAIAGKLLASFTDLGLKALKNIAEPVRTYALSPIPEAKSIAVDAVSRHIAEKKGLPHWVWAAAALAAIAVVVGAWLFLTQLKTTSTHRPTIAVLPFANVSGYPRLGYFSDGMSEGVISMLARFPDLSVVGRSSSFFYKGKGADARQIGKDLGVDYVLEGFVNKEADWVDISARLIDAKTGELVWPNRLEKWGADPLVVQDQVTNRILDTLAGETGKRGQALYRLAWGKDTANLDEYDHYLRGHDLMGTDKDTNEKAGEVLREGLTKFPDSRLLQLELGWFHWERAINRWSDSPSEDYKKAGELARKAFTRPNLTPLERRLGHWLLAFVNTQERNFDEALKEADLAMGLAPYDAEMMGDLSKVLVVAGRPEQAIEWADSAIAGDPGNKAKYLYNKGWALTVTGQHNKAIDALKGAAQWTGTPGLLAINYIRLNRPDEAKAELKKMLTVDPSFNLGKWRDLFIYRDPEVLNREVADLAKAGLPEK